jgi:hypothetical protein
VSFYQALFPYKSSALGKYLRGVKRIFLRPALRDYGGQPAHLKAQGAQVEQLWSTF